MGLFNFLRKNRENLDNKSDMNQIATVSPESNGASLDSHNITGNGTLKGIEQVYSFLQADYESKGYNDALVNPDDSYKMDNIKLIKLDLQITIERVNVYYENLISELNLHINTRSRAGLIDLVQELEARKKLIEEYRLKLRQMTEEINSENGMGQRIILSYQRGFMRGLSALTQSSILNRKI